MTAEAQKKNNISIGIIDSVDSKILNEKRKILIHVPKGEGKKFLVLYVLDGDDPLVLDCIECLLKL